MLTTDLEHPTLPTGSLLGALKYPPLQRWSDRGGASRIIGDAWARYVVGYLEPLVGGPIDLWEGRGTLRALIPLDLDSSLKGTLPRRVRIPDLLLVIEEPAGMFVRALDAKFDISVAEAEQVSIQNLERLLAGSESIARRVMTVSRCGRLMTGEGGVAAPEHWSTRALLPKLDGRDARLHRRQVLCLPVRPPDLFRTVPEAQLVGQLARLDRLPVSPAQDLAVATYYLRLVCACRWCYTEERKPLLDVGDFRVFHDEFAAALAERIAGASSAFQVVEVWTQQVEPIQRARRELEPFLEPPASKEEVKALLACYGNLSGASGLRGVLRTLRERYRIRLVERVGVIPASQAAESVAQRARELATLQRELRSWALEELRRIVTESRAAPLPGTSQVSHT